MKTMAGSFRLGTKVSPEPVGFEPVKGFCLSGTMVVCKTLAVGPVLEDCICCCYIRIWQPAVVNWALSCDRGC